MSDPSDPERDQAKAAFRDWHEAAMPGAGFVLIDRSELEALVERGATAEELHAWLQAQIDRAERERG